MYAQSDNILVKYSFHYFQDQSSNVLATQSCNKETVTVCASHYCYNRVNAVLKYTLCKDYYKDHTV